VWHRELFRSGWTVSDFQPDIEQLNRDDYFPVHWHLLISLCFAGHTLDSPLAARIPGSSEIEEQNDSLSDLISNVPDHDVVYRREQAAIGTPSTGI
jgi:hypothetical protein